MKLFVRSRPSLTILFVSLFWLSYLIFSILFFNKNLTDSYQSSIEQKKIEISYLSNNALLFFQGTNQTATSSISFENSMIFEYLRTSLELEKISFFRVNDRLVILENIKNPPRNWLKQHIPFAKVINESVSKISTDYNEDSVVSNDLIYRNVSLCLDENTDSNCLDKNGISHSKNITLGLYYPLSEYAWRNYDNYIWLVLIDLGIVTLLASSIILITTRDIRQLTRSLQTGNRQTIRHISQLSEEGTTLLMGAQGFETKNQQLTQSNLIYQNQTSPAIRYQLSLSQRLPANVDCTLVRVDLNGYTRLFLESEPNDLVALLNQYFEISRKCIERYSGQIYQYVGDEILFLILNGSNQEPHDSRSLAISAVRDIADSIKEIQIEDKVYGLKIKSSFVQGKLQFVKLDQGYAFTGMPLIESVRILGQVQEKKENSLIVYQEELRTLQSLVDSYETHESTTLKGFSKTSNLIEIRRFKSWNQILSQANPEQYLKYFRIEAAIIWCLEKIIDHLENEKFEISLEIWNFLQTIPFEHRSISVHHLMKDVLDLFWESKSNIKSYRTCGRFISLVPRIDSNLRQSEETKLSLEKFMNHDDFRIQSNTLQALASLDDRFQISKERYDSHSNRIAADALMIAGRTGLDQEIFKYIDRFLTHHDALFRASGLFVATHLIEFHFHRDLVYYNSNPWLQKLTYLVKNFHEDQDPIVKKRASISKNILEDLERSIAIDKSRRDPA